jgi:hypothetical protein
MENVNFCGGSLLAIGKFLGFCDGYFEMFILQYKQMEFRKFKIVRVKYEKFQK